MVSKFIVYVCPVGELGEQLETYFQKSREVCGVNTAHKYMPHCTLTSFFEDETTAIPTYIQSLDRSYNKALPNRTQPALVIADLQFKPDWHGFELESPWVREIIIDFVRRTHSPTQREKLRSKEWLHLSLAYDFQPRLYKTLVEIAQETVDPKASVNWELRFYERHPDWSWTCHKSWKLD
ncbi:MAG: hypothetical protein QNJ54_02955 [Prochloraceae cyanobacterium]|nr:hypothetical protein [Prochloraceae cyanobacterium]